MVEASATALNTTGHLLSTERLVLGLMQAFMAETSACLFCHLYSCVIAEQVSVTWSA